MTWLSVKDLPSAFLIAVLALSDAVLYDAPDITVVEKRPLVELRKTALPFVEALPTTNFPLLAIITPRHTVYQPLAPATGVPRL